MAPARPPWRRTWFIVLCGFVMFVIFIYILASMGRRNNYDDEIGEERNFLHQ